MNSIETSFSPTLFQHFDPTNRIVVVVDILRATTVICTMFKSGVEEVIPVRTLDEAKHLKSDGNTVVAERHGLKVDFADFGNSPFYFTPEAIGGRAVVYSTTNGTNAITIGTAAREVVIGSFVNFAAVKRYLLQQSSDILFLCAGWKGKFCLEDTLFVGAMAEELIQSGKFETICDSTNCALDIWNVARQNLPQYLEHVAQRHRLKKLGFDDVINYCFTFDVTDKLPVLRNGKLVVR